MTTTRYFYDAEFLEDGKTIELISIGIVADDGRELYLVNRDAPWRRIKKDEWLMANVVPSLPHNPAVRDRKEIAEAVREFLTGDDIELWADYGAYDHVVLCQLFGRMIDLPDGIPMFTHDFQQALRAAGNPPMPEQASGQHNALADAWHLKACFDALAAAR